MPLTTLSRTTVLIRSSGLLEAWVDEQIAAFSVETGACYGFNSVGSRIWQLLANPISIADICKLLVDEYQVDSETCEREVLDLVEKLQLEGMISSPSEARG